MRYSLNGGYQSNVENTSGDDYCIEESDGYPPIASVEQEIRDAMEGWMGNPDQRRNILDPSYKKVSIGLAWDRYNFNAVQHFEGYFVEYDRLPTIEHGALAVSGTVKNGVRFEKDQDLTVQIYFDPPPHALTRGQVIRTDCYRGGINVASLRSSASGGADDEYTTSHKPCPDPYDVPLDAPVPLSVEESQEIRRAVYRASQASERRSITASWITARWWNVDGASFEATADIDALLLQYGDGVYTVVVWGPLGGRQVPISRHSIFHGITPPETHTAVPTPTATPVPTSTPHAGADQHAHAGADQHAHAGADQHAHAGADQHAHAGADQHAHAGADQHAHAGADQHANPAQYTNPGQHTRADRNG